MDNVLLTNLMMNTVEALGLSSDMVLPMGVIMPGIVGRLKRVLRDALPRATIGC